MLEYLYLYVMFSRVIYTCLRSIDFCRQHIYLHIIYIVDFVLSKTLLPHSNNFGGIYMIV